MIPFSLYIKEYFWSYDQKYLQIFLLFSLYFSSLNLKYLKLTKMDITHFVMKLFILSTCIQHFLRHQDNENDCEGNLIDVILLGYLNVLFS